MISFRNPIIKATDAADHVNLIRSTLGLDDSVSISCKPQDIDRTLIENLDIDADLTDEQISALLELCPELIEKQV